MRIKQNLTRKLAALCATLLIGITQAHAGQVVYLDFDSQTSVSEDPLDYEYSPVERTSIMTELGTILGPYDVTFTDTIPSEGLYSTLTFNVGSGGDSDGVDLLNRKKNDNARVHVGAALDTVSADVNPSNVFLASVNLAVHEVSHLLGARHHDSFTVPGTGVSAPGDATDFDPAYPGFTLAEFTGDEYLSLATLLGFSEEKLLSDSSFIGPRTSLKLNWMNLGTLTDEFTGNHNEIELAQILPFDVIELENNIPSGPAAGLPIYGIATHVEGSLGLYLDAPEPDYYMISALAGQRWTIEINSESMDRIDDSVDTFLAFLFPDGTPVPYYGDLALNNDGLERTDSLILDVIIPFDGDYIIEVFGNPSGSDLFGDYELFAYTFSTIPEPSSLILLAGLGFAVTRRRVK